MHPRIQHLIQNPFEVQLSDVALLQDEIDKYPYFSTLRALLLFGLKEFEHPSYQEELKKTSIYSPSRVALYHYLQKDRQPSTQQEEINDWTNENDQTLEIVEEEPTEEILFLDSSNSFEFIEEIEEETQEEFIQEQENIAENDWEEIDFEVETNDEIESAIAETENEAETDVDSEVETTTKVENEQPQAALTFTEWLKISQAKSNQTSTEKVETKTEVSPTEKDIKFQLIDEFIEKAPKITPIKKQDNTQVVIKNDPQIEYSDLMTETLAQIYTEQKKFDKAIRAYKILILKYPDKKEFFEDKIEEIKFIRDQKQ